MKNQYLGIQVDIPTLFVRHSATQPLILSLITFYQL